MGRKKQNSIRSLVGTGDKNFTKGTYAIVTEEIKTVDIGLDISTSVVGVVLLNSRTSKMEKMFAIKLTGTKFDDLWSKADYVQSELEREIVNCGFVVKKIYVEENAMAFTKGFSSAGTLFTLAKFNGIVSNDARRMFGCKPKMINVRSARKQLGIKIDTKDKSTDTKTKVFTMVRTLNPTFQWEQHVAKTGKSKGQLVYAKHNCDIADAWVICRGGQLIEP